MPDSNPPTSGHGWVFRAPGGYKARCGGPGNCSDCDADLRRLAAAAKRSDVWDNLEQELQATFDRARAAT